METDMPKLYRVEYTVVAYVYADNSTDAQNDFSREIMSDCFDPWRDGDATEVVSHDRPEAGWDGTYLVYHDGREDLPLADVWPGGLT